MNLKQKDFSLFPSVWVGLLGVLMLMACGCGVKAMPVVPGKTLPAPVRDLTGQIASGQAALSWTIPAQDPKSEWLPEAVVVYRSKVLLQEEACEQCPLKFEPIARLGIPGGLMRKMHYVDTLETGFRYTYKVVLIGDKEERGEESNLFSIQP